MVGDFVLTARVIPSSFGEFRIFDCVGAGSVDVEAGSGWTIVVCRVVTI